MDYILIISGLLLLFLGGEALVRGSISISKRLGISAVLIGVVIVGFGTSTPELLVSVQASLNGQPDIALGNVVGSNIANVLLILGLAAMITPILCTDRAIMRDSAAVVAASFVLLVMSLLGVVSQVSGILIFTLLVAYLIYAYKSQQRAIESPANSTEDGTVYENEAEEFDSNLGLTASLMASVFGIGMLVFGADFLVEGASNVARSFGISEAVIGLSLVAVGTSLPEMAASISAAMKKNSDVIIGNILGSNLFNIMAILGIASIIKPIPVEGQIAEFDIPLTAGLAVFCLLIILRFKQFSKLTGVIFLIAYASYILWIYNG